MEQNKTPYTPPTGTITRVRLEEGIAQAIVPLSARTHISPDWIEVQDVVGADPATQGGDIFLQL